MTHGQGRVAPHRATEGHRGAGAPCMWHVGVGRWQCTHGTGHSFLRGGLLFGRLFPLFCRLLFRRFLCLLLPCLLRRTLLCALLCALLRGRLLLLPTALFPHGCLLLLPTALLLHH